MRGPTPAKQDDVDRAQAGTKQSSFCDRDLVLGYECNGPGTGPDTHSDTGTDTRAGVSTADPAAPDKFDWIQLTSGEWLKGELIALYDDCWNLTATNSTS